jgi:autotransporter adhesin
LASGQASTAVGHQATATGSGSSAFGVASRASGDDSFAAGLLATAAGPNSVVIGPGAADNGVANSVVLGPGAAITAGLAGTNIALGEGTIATRGAMTNYAAYGIAAPQSSAGELALGNRQITGLAAGIQANDAVNLEQLQGAIAAIPGAASYFVSDNPGGAMLPVSSGASASAGGYDAQATGANATAIGNGALAGGTVMNGLANAGTTALGQGAQAGAAAAGQVNATAVGQGAMADAANASAFGEGAEASAANSVALGQGSVADTADTVSVGAVGSERRIVNVADGAIAATSTDAVNGSQFFTLQQQITSGGIGLVQQAGAGQPITVGAATDGAAVDFTGADGARVLTGVRAGTLTAASTDAVNGSQLLSANQRIAMAFGGGASVNSSGQLTAPSYAVQGGTYNNVGNALGALDGQVTSNTTNIAALSTQINNGSVGLVQQDPTTRTLTVGATTDGNVVDVSGTAGNRQVAGVAAGALAATSTEAVNGSQLFATNQAVAANTTDIASLTSTVMGIQTGSSTYVKVNSTAAPAAASGTESIAVGGNALASASGAVAVGMDASSTGTNAIAIGMGASATGSVAVGASAQAGGGGAAYGDYSVATAEDSTALGPNASATGTASVAVGHHASATASNAVAIGEDSVADEANTVSVGSSSNRRRITNVAQGVNPTDAANVGQLDSVASGLQTQVNQNRREARSGIALALAASSLQYDQRPGKASVAAAFGNFKGQSGFAVGFGYAATDRFRLNASFEASPGIDDYGVSAGASWTLN